jgi:tRNA (guanine-N7-)-methyltransferase
MNRVPSRLQAAPSGAPDSSGTLPLEAPPVPLPSDPAPAQPTPMPATLETAATRPSNPPSPGSPAGGATPPHRPIRSFVLRAGRIGPGQARALAELGPRFVLPFQATPIDPAAVFGRRAPLVLEIGFGMGDATARIAAARPDTDFIGCEVHEPGVGALLRRIDELGLGNLRIVRHDAVEVLEQMIAPASLAGIHVFFPDPWHKKKHHKRRLIQPAFVARLATRLAPGGTLHCATDWEPYAQQMLEVLSAEPALANTAAGYAPRPEVRPLTKFEQRGLRLGHGVWDLVFRRV